MNFRHLLLPLTLLRTEAFNPIVTQLSHISLSRAAIFETTRFQKRITLTKRQESNMADSNFVNATEKGDIPTFDGSEKAKATDFANYFCSYAQLYHQKQMLADHNRMAAYHAAIMGNPDVFKDKVVMDVGTGSGILACWAAQAGAKRVYAGKRNIRFAIVCP